MNEALKVSVGLFVLSLFMSNDLQASAAQGLDCGAPVQAVAVNGTELHYVECGSGEPVIWVHGSTGNLSWAASHADALSDRFKSISYSRRFHTPNDPPRAADEYSLDQHVADLAVLIDELNVGVAHIVGHSYGAYVALALAVEHPEKVLSLVLGEPPVLPLLGRSAVGQAILDSWNVRTRDPARAAAVSGDTISALRTFLDAVIGPGWFDQLPPESREGIVSTAGPEFALELSTDEAIYMPAIPCGELSEIDVPALLLTGENSIASLLLVTAELEECLETEEHTMIPDVGHVMYRNPEAFDEHLREFLGGME